MGCGYKVYKVTRHTACYSKESLEFFQEEEGLNHIPKIFIQAYRDMCLIFWVFKIVNLYVDFIVCSRIFVFTGIYIYTYIYIYHGQKEKKLAIILG